MTTSTPTLADTLRGILHSIASVYDGEIYAEDVNAVMEGMGMAPSLYPKVSSILEDLIPTMRRRGAPAVAAAERNTALLLGLAALSQ